MLTRFLVLAGAVLEPKYPQTAKIFLHLFEKGFKGAIEAASRCSQIRLQEDDAHRMSALSDLVAYARQETKEGAPSKAKPVLLVGACIIDLDRGHIYFSNVYKLEGSSTCPRVFSHFNVASHLST